MASSSPPETGDFKITWEIWLMRILGPILVLIGTVGNILIVAIYTKVEMRKTTAAVYLGALAIADSLALYTGLLRHALYAYIGQDISDDSAYLCKTLPFFQFTFQYFSAWILVTFTAERCLVMWYPALLRPSRSRAAILVLLLFNFAFLVNIFFLSDFDLVPLTTRGEAGRTRTVKRCRPATARSEETFPSVWPWWNLTAECVLPTLLLMLGNFFIILGVEKHKTATREYEDTSDTSCTTVDATHKLHPHHTAQVHTGHPSRAPLFLMIAVNITHILLTAPRDIFYLLFYTYPDQLAGMPYAKVYALRHCLTLIGYTNNAINFPLYCATRRDFRHAAHVVLHALSACCRSDPPPRPFVARRRNVIDPLPVPQPVHSLSSRRLASSTSMEQPYLRELSPAMKLALLWKCNDDSVGGSPVVRSAGGAEIEWTPVLKLKSFEGRMQLLEGGESKGGDESPEALSLSAFLEATIVDGTREAEDEETEETVLCKKFPICSSYEEKVAKWQADNRSKNCPEELPLDQMRTRQHETSSNNSCAARCLLDSNSREEQQNSDHVNELPVLKHNIILVRSASPEAQAGDADDSSSPRNRSPVSLKAEEDDGNNGALVTYDVDEGEAQAPRNNNG